MVHCGRYLKLVISSCNVLAFGKADELVIPAFSCLDIAVNAAANASMFGSTSVTTRLVASITFQTMICYLTVFFTIIKYFKCALFISFLSYLSCCLYMRRYLEQDTCFYSYSRSAISLVLIQESSDDGFSFQVYHRNAFR